MLCRCVLRSFAYISPLLPSRSPASYLLICTAKPQYHNHSHRTTVPRLCDPDAIKPNVYVFPTAACSKQGYAQTKKWSKGFLGKRLFFNCVTCDTCSHPRMHKRLLALCFLCRGTVGRMQLAYSFLQPTFFCDALFAFDLVLIFLFRGGEGVGWDS